MKRKLTIGILVENQLGSGGGFSYASIILNAISKEKNNKFRFEVFTTVYDNLILIKNLGLNGTYTNRSARDWLKILIKKRIFAFGKSIKKVAKNKKIDIFHFLGPYGSWKIIEDNFPFIFTIHDIGHYELPFFPEYSGREFWRREEDYRMGALRSFKLVVDSDVTRNKLKYYYGTPEDKVIVNKFSTKKHLIIPTKQLPRQWGKERFVIYPAQFWAHKNHAYLIESLEFILEKGLDINMVFCGGDMGNMEFIKNLAKEKGVMKKVHFLGFVSDSELMGLYEDALAMIMPTYLSTTNIPPLEAFAKKLPVLYPSYSKYGVDEYLVSNTIPINLNCTESVYKGLKLIIDEDPSIAEMVNSAYIRTIELCEADHLHVLRCIWNEYSEYRKAWF